MPQSKTKRRKSKDAGSKDQRRPAWGGAASKSTRTTNIALALLAVLFIGGGALYWFLSQAQEGDFLALAAQGQSGLGAVESFTLRNVFTPGLLTALALLGLLPFATRRLVTLIKRNRVAPGVD